jgi:hypothetical protein
MLAMVSGPPLTHCEPWLRAKGWRTQGLGTHAWSWDTLGPHNAPAVPKEQSQYQGPLIAGLAAVLASQGCVEKRAARDARRAVASSALCGGVDAPACDALDRPPGERAVLCCAAVHVPLPLLWERPLGLPARAGAVGHPYGQARVLHQPGWQPAGAWVGVLWHGEGLTAGIACISRHSVRGMTQKSLGQGPLARWGTHGIAWTTWHGRAFCLGH